MPKAAGSPLRRKDESALPELGHLGCCILFGVSHLGPDVASATTLHAHLRERTGLTKPLASIHAALRRMEGHGWLEARFGPSRPVRGGRRPVLYCLTPQGLAVRDDYVTGHDALRNGTEFEYPMTGPRRDTAPNPDEGPTP